MNTNQKKKFILVALNEGYSLDEISDFLSSQKQSELQPAPLANEPMDIRYTSAGNILSQEGQITQAFGNYNPALYRGINKSMINTGVDIGVPTGTDVTLPSGEWEVEESGSGWNRGYGNSVLVRNVKTNEKLRFSHLSRVAPLRKGQKLSGGMTFAQTGATGYATGPHLDLEYYDQLNRIQNFLKSSYARNL